MDYGTDWESYWEWLLEEHKLKNYVSEMDQVDDALGMRFT